MFNSRASRVVRMSISSFKYCHGCDGYNCDEIKGCAYPDLRHVVASQQPSACNYYDVLEDYESPELINVATYADYFVEWE